MEPDDKLWHPMSKKVQRGPEFINGLHNFSSGYAILVPGYKFRGCQFEIPGYTRTIGGRRGLSYIYHLSIPLYCTQQLTQNLFEEHIVGHRKQNAIYF